MRIVNDPGTDVPKNSRVLDTAPASGGLRSRLSRASGVGCFLNAMVVSSNFGADWLAIGRPVTQIAHAEQCRDSASLNRSTLVPLTCDP
jgi:hypothetical protein